jgi:hypothetical protein
MQVEAVTAPHAVLQAQVARLKLQMVSKCRIAAFWFRQNIRSTLRWEAQVYPHVLSENQTEGMVEHEKSA